MAKTCIVCTNKYQVNTNQAIINYPLTQKAIRPKQTGKPKLSLCSSDSVRNGIFDAFHENYIEYTCYMNDIITSLGPSKDPLKKLENENTFQHKSIRMLEKEIQYFKFENTQHY